MPPGRTAGTEYVAPTEEELAAMEAELAAQEAAAVPPPADPGYVMGPQGGDPAVEYAQQQQVAAAPLTPPPTAVASEQYVAPPPAAGAPNYVTVPPAGLGGTMLQGSSVPAPPPPETPNTGGGASTYYGGQLTTDPPYGAYDTQTLYPSQGATAAMDRGIIEINDDPYGAYGSAQTLPASRANGTDWAGMLGAADASAAPSGGRVVRPAPSSLDASAVTGLPAFATNFAASRTFPDWMPGTLSARPPGWDSPNPPRERANDIRTLPAPPPGTPGTGEGIPAPYDPSTAHASDYLLPATTWDRAQLAGGDVLGTRTIGNPTMDWLQGVQPDAETAAEIDRQIAANRANQPVSQPAPPFQGAIGGAVGSLTSGLTDWLGERTSDQGRSANRDVLAAIAAAPPGLGPTQAEVASGDLIMPPAPASLPTPDIGAGLGNVRASPLTTDVPRPTTAGITSDTFLPAVNFLEDTVAPQLPWNRPSQPAPPAPTAGANPAIAQPSALDTPGRTPALPASTALPEGATTVEEGSQTWVKDANGAYVGVVNPATGEMIPLPSQEGKTPEAWQAEVSLLIAGMQADAGTPATTATPATATVPAPATSTTSSTTSSTSSGGSGSSGGGGSWDSDWSGSGSGGSRRSRSSFDDLFAEMADREFTAEDFMDDAEGDEDLATAMAKAANKKRRKRGKRGTTTRTGRGASGMGKGFPFNRPASPIRTNILASLSEAFRQD